MSLSATELAADLVEIESDLAQNATFQRHGKPPLAVAAVVGDVSAAERGAFDGLEGDESIVLTVRRALLSWLPAPGDKCVVGGDTYRVARVKQVREDAAVSFELTEQTR